MPCALLVLIVYDMKLSWSLSPRFTRCQGKIEADGNWKINRIFMLRNIPCNTKILSYIILKVSVNLIKISRFFFLDFLNETIQVHIMSLIFTNFFLFLLINLIPQQSCSQFPPLVFYFVEVLISMKLKQNKNYSNSSVF